MKPFTGTLRVTNPVRQSRASSRKRVLRGGGRPPLRSVASQIKRCVIEPRNFLVVSLRRGQTRGPSQALAAPGPISVPGHTGVGGTWRMITRVPRELWETLPSPSWLPAGDPAYQLQDDPRPRSAADGDERGTKRWYRRAKETKRGERDGKESQRPIVVMKRGNGPSRTPWSEGSAASWSGGWNHAEDTVPQKRVTAKPPDRVRDSEPTT